MNDQPKKPDLHKALTDPHSVFSNPAEVVDSAELSREEKIEILNHWQYDARDTEVATEENMPGETESRLSSILEALNALGASLDTDSSSPTKQGM